jgi:hypothetical protein
LALESKKFCKSSMKNTSFAFYSPEALFYNFYSFRMYLTSTLTNSMLLFPCLEFLGLATSSWQDLAFGVPCVILTNLCSPQPFSFLRKLIFFLRNWEEVLLQRESTPQGMSAGVLRMSHLASAYYLFYYACVNASHSWPVWNVMTFHSVQFFSQCSLLPSPLPPFFFFLFPFVFSFSLVYPFFLLFERFSNCILSLSFNSTVIFLTSRALY